MSFIDNPHKVSQKKTLFYFTLGLGPQPDIKFLISIYKVIVTYEYMSFLKQKKSWLKFLHFLLLFRNIRFHASIIEIYIDKNIFF